MTQSKFIRRAIVMVLGTVCLLSWAFLAATFAFDMDKPLRIAAAFAAAFSTEGLFWVGAALLGWKAFEKFSIWNRLTGKNTEVQA